MQRTRIIETSILEDQLAKITMMMFKNRNPSESSSGLIGLYYMDFDIEKPCFMH